MSIRMEAPVCLIENREDGTLQVNPVAASILSSIEQPVVVVGIVGMYRTGKSYLMNKLAKAHRGFELGATVESKTKGIWMWCVPHPTKESHTLVLLDTEGLGDVKKGDKRNDLNIFCLSVILSSALVYNSKGTIDEDAIEKLRFVSELADFIKVKSKDNEDEEDEFSRHFPIFIWAVRDFILKLESDGKKITEDDYLESALAPQKTKVVQNPKRVEERNHCRGCIRMYFKNRKCFVFDPPSGRSDVLQRMDEVSEKEISPTFLAQAEKFCTYIYENSEVKYLDQIHEATGKMLGELATLYTNAIMSSKATSMENVVMSISQIENEAAVREATEHYEKMMKERGRFPTETDKEFTDLSIECEKEALQIFMKKSFKDSELSFQKQYMENMELKKHEFSEMNKMKSLKYCEELLRKHSKDHEEAIRQGLYCTPGGYQKFQEDMGQIVERYNKEPGKGLQAESALQDFIMTKETLKISIMKADKTLTEQQKKDEENKSCRKMEELEKKIKELKLSQESKKAEDEKRTADMNCTAMLEKKWSENVMLQEKLNLVMQAKEREQGLYTSQGFYEEADMYCQQLKDLKGEAENLKETSWVDSAVDMFCGIAQFFSWQGAVVAGVVRTAHGFFKKKA
ncbi:guanylate-binding protein 3-like [Aquarana catesbeiana]|uniref:guanylate-binding protein 3-like n=1 Tax=Aquarana catesbeiana TaxID=8400 RepID=UPI003CC9C7E6